VEGKERGKEREGEKRKIEMMCYKKHFREKTDQNNEEKFQINNIMFILNTPGE
jgi:hypothetical protein